MLTDKFLQYYTLKNKSTLRSEMFYKDTKNHFLTNISNYDMLLFSFGWLIVKDGFKIKNLQSFCVGGTVNILKNLSGYSIYVPIQSKLVEILIELNWKLYRLDLSSCGVVQMVFIKD